MGASGCLESLNSNAMTCRDENVLLLSEGSDVDIIAENEGGSDVDTLPSVRLKLVWLQ